jgi:hypothetical protein
MKIFPGQQAENFEEAVSLAFQMSGIKDMSVDSIEMFTSLAEDYKTGPEADKAIGAAVRNRYGNKATWRAERWFVPIPKLYYEGKDVPRLIIEITTHLVASVSAKTPNDFRLISTVGPIGKPETLVIPMLFLHALIENDLERFVILARNSVYTTWEVPGTKPVRLPSASISKLSETLKCGSVVAWLEEFGVQGRCVVPLVAGSLIGLAFQNSPQPDPISQRGFTVEDLVSALVNMLISQQKPGRW